MAQRMPPPPALPPSPDRVTTPAPAFSPRPTVAATVPEARLVVARVIDGDTIELQDGRKVRYIGIDAPEASRDECFAAEAKAANARLVLGQPVRLERDVSDTDRYGRLLRYVHAGETFVNVQLVAGGFARAVTYPPDVRHRDALRAAAAEAKAKRRGLWAGCPLPSPPKTTDTVNSSDRGNLRYEESESVEPVDGCAIKGNINAKGEKIYHLPGCGSYEKTAIDAARGERWFCTEAEALAAGWRKAGNCP